MKIFIIAFTAFFTLFTQAQVLDCTVIEGASLETVKYNPETNYFKFTYNYSTAIQGEIYEGLEVVKGYLSSRGAWSDGWTEVTLRPTSKKDAEYRLFYRSLPQEMMIEAYINCN